MSGLACLERSLHQGSQSLGTLLHRAQANMCSQVDMPKCATWLPYTSKQQSQLPDSVAQQPTGMCWLQPSAFCFWQ